jgi:predicted nucleotidyltransferase
MKEHLKKYICSKLNELADHQNIKILHAIESGSRAWGFPSKDSDYDVRFIYVHNLDHYLSVDRKRDVIETPIVHDPTLGVDFDMNGWDLKKAVYLALRGNAVVNEWHTSPIQYVYNEEFHSNLKKFINEVSDLKAYYHFYRNYMRQPWESYREDQAKQIKIKHYCYVLRCALALEWLENQKTPPPMDVPSLLKEGSCTQELKDQIDFLTSKKAEAIEADTIERNQILDDFIDKAIFEERQRPFKEKLEEMHISKANQLFKEMVLLNNSK